MRAGASDPGKPGLELVLACGDRYRAAFSIWALLATGVLGVRCQPVAGSERKDLNYSGGGAESG